MKYNVLPADTYMVLNKTMITEQDRKIILQLYQPIIGGISSTLYFTLWSYLDRNEISSLEFTHHHLMTSLGLKLEDIIIAREKLEGIGLMKTYLKKGDINHYIYELYSPLSPKEFIENPILNTALYNQVGQTEYENRIEEFRVPKVDLKNFKDITMLFREVFDVTDQDAFLTQNEYKSRNKGTMVLQETIDIQTVFNLIDEALLNIQTVYKEERELIYKLCYVYNLNEEQIASIIKNSLTSKKTIDISLLRQNCRNFYEFENHGKTPNLIYKNQPEFLRRKKEGISNRDKVIYTFETTTPYHFLTSKNKGVDPTKAELLLLESLMIDFSLNPGVINVLIDYVLRINNNKLTKKYVETIASQWKRANVQTVEEAMKIAEKEYKGRKKTKNTVEEKPDWFHQDVKSKKASDEKIKEIEEMLEGL